MLDRVSLDYLKIKYISKHLDPKQPLEEKEGSGSATLKIKH